MSTEYSPMVVSMEVAESGVTVGMDVSGAYWNSKSALPTGGSTGDILTKTGADAVGWVTPATDFSGDNTRPATASLVNAQVGNITALLATI